MFWANLKHAAIVMAACVLITASGRVTADPVATATPARAAESDLIVHEWGVAIRQQTSHGSVLSSPAELVSGLPSFVVCQKSERTLQPQGWDKPVIWFHGPDGIKVNVRVMASQGFATANFPSAELLTRTFSHSDRKAMMVSLLTESAGFRWEGTLTREPAQKVLEVPKDHWWQIARSAGGLYFNAKDASERFLFYEATAFQEPMVTASVDANAITLHNAYEAPSGQAILLLNSADKHYLRVVETIDAKGAMILRKDEVTKVARSGEDVVAACAGQWKSFGMTGPEAEAIAAVWREDLLKPQRILLISRMPAKLYEAMFPLTISPSPKELVRVGMVFDALESQSEAPSWLPDLPDIQEMLAKAARGLGSNDWKERDEASRELEKLGNRARDTLEELVNSKDPEVKSRAGVLLKKITPEVSAPAHEGTDENDVVIHAIK